MYQWQDSGDPLGFHFSDTRFHTRRIYHPRLPGQSGTWQAPTSFSRTRLGSGGACGSVCATAYCHLGMDGRTLCWTTPSAVASSWCSGRLPGRSSPCRCLPHRLLRGCISVRRTKGRAGRGSPGRKQALPVSRLLR